MSSLPLQEKMNTKLITANNDLILDDNGWAIKNTQYISDEFLNRIKNLRDNSNAPAGDYHEVADIPCAVLDKWMREGFNIYDPSVKVSEIVARLKRENLDAFISTNKRV